MTRCRSFALTMAGYHTDLIYLRHLVRGRRAVAAIGDHEIRAIDLGASGASRVVETT